MERKAKVFNTGRSQAVRLLSEFRFNTKEVFVRRDATTGDVILSTKPESKSLDEVFARLDAAGIPMLLCLWLITKEQIDSPFNLPDYLSSQILPFHRKAPVAIGKEVTVRVLEQISHPTSADPNGRS
jgi:antitoxin VapB